MEIKKVGTPNYSSSGSKKVGIVLHATLGSMQSAVNWLTNKKSQVSSHFVIGRLGEVTQLAPLDKDTWHAGNVYKPSPRGKKILKRNILRKGGYANPNKSFIGVEFACGYDIDRDGVLESWEKLYTSYQIKSLVWLISKVIQPELNLKINGENLLTHKDIASYKPNLEIQRAMVLNELEKNKVDTPPSDLPKQDFEIIGNKNESKVSPTNEMLVKHGEKIKFDIKGDDVFIRKY